MYWRDGRIYEGHWINGKMHGEGKYFWPDGSNYVGNFENDKENGHGVLTNSKGLKKEGTWKMETYMAEWW